MNREVQVRICEGLGVKFPGPTRQLIGDDDEIVRTTIQVQMLGMVQRGDGERFALEPFAELLGRSLDCYI